MERNEYSRSAYITVTTILVKQVKCPVTDDPDVCACGSAGPSFEPKVSPVRMLKINISYTVLDNITNVGLVSTDLIYWHNMATGK